MSITYLEFKNLSKNEWNKIINQFEGNISQYYYDMISYVIFLLHVISQEEIRKNIL